MITEVFSTHSNYQIEVEQLLGMEPLVRVSDLVRNTRLSIYLTSEECLEWADKLTRAAESANLRGVGENKTGEE